MRFMVSMVI